jgi:hypothetical protein
MCHIVNSGMLIKYSPLSATQKRNKRRRKAAAAAAEAAAKPVEVEKKKKKKKEETKELAKDMPPPAPKYVAPGRLGARWDDAEKKIVL